MFKKIINLTNDLITDVKKNTAIVVEKSAVAKEAFIKATEKLPVAKISDTYDAGLPDVKGPKPATLVFFRDRVEISIGFLSKEKICLKPNHILELEFGVTNANNTTNVMKGAMVGGLLMGGIGALAMAGHASKQRKEDVLHLVIYYKGSPRALHFQNKNTQKLYKEFEKLFALREAPIQLLETKIKAEVIEATQSNASTDLVKQLTDLNNLVQQGILTKEEFDIQKGKILNA